jgi:hypothetical protein
LAELDATHRPRLQGASYVDRILTIHSGTVAGFVGSETWITGTFSPLSPPNCDNERHPGDLIALFIEHADHKQ